MKKSGFTLAEVLITLGIIGVVAALTAPALVTSGQNQANASRLAVTVSNLENAFTNAIAQEGVESLYQTKMWQGNVNSSPSATEDNVKKFVGQLGQYIHLNGYAKESFQEFYGVDLKEAGWSNTANGPFYMNKSGGKGGVAGTGLSPDAALPIVLKNGAVAFMELSTGSNGRTIDEDHKYSKDDIINAGGALYNKAGKIYIDVNGRSGPNTVGRDIFAFALGSNGILYPYGGYDFAVYTNPGAPGDGVWTKKEGTYCCVDNEIVKGWGCTARVIEEGYKINY